MRKLLVKIFNLVYLAGAIFAILSLCFEPLFKLSIDLDIKQTDLETVLNSTMNKEGSAERPQYRVMFRDSSGDLDVDLTKKLTPAYIAQNIGDIKTEEPLTIEIPAKVCFQPKNEAVIKEVIMENVDQLSLSLSKLLGTKLKVAIKNVVKDTANDIISQSINKQIINLYGENSGKTANEEEINQIVDNVYNLFDNNENTSIDDVMKTISGDKVFTKVEEPLTGKLIEKTNQIYYVKDETAEDGYRPVNYKLPSDCTDEFDPNVDYYTVSYTSGMFSILQSLEDEGNPQVYSSEDTVTIKNQMTSMLESQEGLTETKFTEVAAGTVTAADIPQGNSTYYILVDLETGTCELAQSFNPEMTYFTKDGEGVYTPVEPGVVTAEDFPELNSKYYVLDSETNTYVLATSFDATATYYTKEVIIKNIDDALAFILGNIGGGSESTGMMKRSNEEIEDSELDKKIADTLKGFLQLDKVEELADKTVTKYTPLICTGILVLFAIPWVFFALKTLFRTLRKKKCWTKFWFLFIFGFIQLVLGAVVTLGIRFGLPKILSVVGEQVGGNAGSYVNILSNSVLKIQFGCLMASYVYIVILLTAIPYMIIAHRVKVEYRFDKRDAKKAKKEAKKAKRAAKAA